ncbi:hypothetical protein MPH_04130 [Macrophomina phaseolina MS6]|uniref:Uncharacterized protein n=1 Tax=Macrophomina phaseolina (strain MS6) TaxID=1126212 RepID=K2SPC1_MACPH|nr:hypothetical protein MPH_04130 [Macrophomina phaseolina MS6]
MARLDRVEKQRELLRRRANLIISRKVQTVEELKELDRLKSAREAGEPVDPKNAEAGRSSKRLRSGASANTTTGPSQSIGSPRAGSGAAPSEGSELVNQARQSPLPDFNFGSFVYNESAVLVDLGFGDRTHQ